MSKRGIWKLTKFVDGAPTRIFAGGVHNIHNVANDCDGELLWDYMTEHGLVEDWSQYETDGDSESCAIMHKSGDGPDFRWEFVGYAEKRFASDDCHTFS